MNKKIIYISGGANFSVAAIQAAFDEVRETLNLSADTVLFGVPTDEVEVGANHHSPSRQSEVACEQATENPTQTPIPILSVLSAKSDEPDTAKVKIEAVSVSIEEIITDDVPTATVETTLEQLLESMTPLREDAPTPSAPAPEPMPDDDMDATLSQLATEFASTQDDIPEPAPIKKSTTSGKIGKLKNILPFKKAKREDSGIMGDLFGWAGIAANDDEFSMPGFFVKSSQS